MAIRFLDEQTTAPVRTSRIRFLDEPSQLPPDVQKPSFNIPARRILGEAVSAIPPIAEAKALIERKPSPTLRATGELLNLLPIIAGPKLVLGVAGGLQKGEVSPRQIGLSAARSLPFSKLGERLIKGQDIQDLTSLTETATPTPNILKRAREEFGVELPERLGELVPRPVERVLTALSPGLNLASRIPTEFVEDLASFSLGLAPQEAGRQVVRRTALEGLTRAQTELARRTAQRQAHEAA